MRGKTSKESAERFQALRAARLKAEADVRRKHIEARAKCTQRVLENLLNMGSDVRTIADILNVTPSMVHMHMRRFKLK